jgi:hypothetical protein
MLPHPSKRAELELAPDGQRLPRWLINLLAADLSDLADLVNKVDTDPIKNCEEAASSKAGPLLLLWNQMKSSVNDRSSFHAGVDRWRHLTGTRPPTELLAAVGSEEKARVEAATKPTRIAIHPRVAVVESPVWGFDVWYRRHAPVVVQLKGDGEIDIGCVDLDTAVTFFGPRGLMEIFPELDKITGKGWGGRETICGGPRGVKRTWEEAVEIGFAVAKAIAL